MVKQDKIKGPEAGGRESKKIAIFEVINRGAVVTKKRKGVGFEKFKCDNVGENLQGCGSSKKEKKRIILLRNLVVKIRADRSKEAPTFRSIV